MNLVQKERRAIADLTIAMTIGLLLAFLNLTLNFSANLHAFFSDYMTASTVAWIVNGLFLWLVAMLAVAYGRWRRESRRRSELEDIVSSISPDALVVVSPSRRIEMCNDSVERINKSWIAKKVEIDFDADRKLAKNQARVEFWSFTGAKMDTITHKNQQILNPSDCQIPDFTT